MTPSPRPALLAATRRAAAAAALCCLTALVAACGSAHPGAAPDHAGTSHPASPSHAPSASHGGTSTPSSPASTAPSTSAGTGSGSTTAASAPGCLSRYLHAFAADENGTAGSVYVDIDFKNLGNQPCTLYGYPGVSFATAQPVQQVGLAATENPATPRQLVTLQPGQYAIALLRVVDAGNYSPGQCRPVRTPWLQVIPPNQTVPLYVPYPSTACAGPVNLLTVNTVS